MHEESSWQSSPQLLNADRSRLVIVDMQERLLPSIYQQDRVLSNIRFAMDAAHVFRIRTIVTEQYPKGLGLTVAELAQHEAIGVRLEKTRFSAAEVLHEAGELQSTPSMVPQIVLVGIETHICIQQTALDLLSQGCQVVLAVDATGSRDSADRDVALWRMRDAGVIVTTVETIGFEWCRKAGSAEFKALSQLVKSRDHKKNIE
jgi:nicotinamidase-related amidase